MNEGVGGHQKVISNYSKRKCRLNGAIQYDRAYLRGIGDGRMTERQDWSEGRLRLNGRSVEPWNG